MKSLFPFVPLLFFLLVPSIVTARKDVGDYWPRGGIKDEPRLEASSKEVTKTDCHDSETHELMTMNLPDILIYHNDNIKKIQDKSFSEDFKQPDVSIYHNNDITKIQDKSFFKDFKQPDITIYHNNDIKKIQGKSFSEDFKQPDITIYHNNDIKKIQNRLFSENFK